MPKNTLLSQDEFFYEMRDKAGDARMALAHELAHGAPAIESIRNKIAIGDLSEANRLLGKTETQSQDGFEKYELLFEVARLAFHDGRYQEALKICGDVIYHSPWPITKMSAYQVRAAAHFELKDWALSYSDIKSAEAMNSLFPSEAVALNIEALRLRLHIRKKNLEEGAYLLKNWFLARSQKDNWTLDRLHQFERIRIDFLRWHKVNYFEEALKSYHYAVGLGDTHFIELAMVDLWSSLKGSTQLSALLGENIGKKTRALVEQALGSVETGYETGQNLHDYLQHNVSMSISFESLPSTPDLVLDEALALLINIDQQTVHDLSRHLQIIMALKVLSAGTVSKELFFEKIWPGISFDPDRHDNIIRALISRTRKKTGASIISLSGDLSFTNSIYVPRDSLTI